VENNRRHRIRRLIAFLSRECADAKPETAVTLSVLSGSSVLAFSRLPDNAVATALTRAVRLFF
jgi:RNase P protein component